MRHSRWFIYIQQLQKRRAWMWLQECLHYAPVASTVFDVRQYWVNITQNIQPFKILPQNIVRNCIVATSRRLEVCQRSTCSYHVSYINALQMQYFLCGRAGGGEHSADRLQDRSLEIEFTVCGCDWQVFFHVIIH